ncbi:MAG: 6-phosphogluconolactonase, partial [Novosphingobium sp.]|nr:6-phosphogluconolactonase [Novosphingobium sp.]
MIDVAWAQPGDAAAVAAHIARVLSRPGPKRLAFTGGSTPLKVFALLAGQELDWTGATIALTDDRCVPDDHPASNFGKLHAALAGTGAVFE